MEGYDISNITTNVNQLHHEVVGLATGLNNFAGNDSASRLNMVTSHLSQMTVISGAEPRRLYSGIEREYGKATFKAEMPVRGQVIDVITKYRGGIGHGSIDSRLNPVTHIIYQDLDAAEKGILKLDHLEVPTWHCIHQSYGYRYNISERLKALREYDFLAAGETFALSPNVCPATGDYKFGRETKIAYMSVPGIIEDGYVVRKGLLKELSFKAYGKLMFGWGKNKYPLNIYGDEENYKPFPDVGDVVREDGLVYASREYDPVNAGIEMSARNLRRVDTMSDKTIYGPPGAKIIDVTIMRNEKTLDLTPAEMNAQAQKYLNAQHGMSNRVIKTIDDFKRKYRGTPVTLGDTLHLLKADALIDVMPKYKNVNKAFRANIIDDWTVMITYEKEEIPTVGYKITGLHGDKGVICAVWNDEDMPVDQHGTVVDIIKDGDSTIKRMNSGAVYEHYNGASLDEADRKVRYMAANGSSMLEVYDWLLGYYEASSPYYYQLVSYQNQDDISRSKHAQWIHDNGISVFLPPNSPTIGIDQIRNLEAYLPVQFGKLKYRGRSGNMVTTVSDIMIGAAVTIVLEKTGSIWSAVSSAKRQHFGFLTKLTNSNKLSLPWREAPTRFTGEAEVRLMMAYSNPRTVADILAIQNDPNAMRSLIRNRYNADKPTAIRRAVEWDEVGRGNHRAVNYVTNILACGGIEYGRD